MKGAAEEKADADALDAFAHLLRRRRKIQPERPQHVSRAACGRRGHIAVLRYRHPGSGRNERRRRRDVERVAAVSASADYVDGVEATDIHAYRSRAHGSRRACDLFGGYGILRDRREKRRELGFAHFAGEDGRKEALRFVLAKSGAVECAGDYGFTCALRHRFARVPPSRAFYEVGELLCALRSADGLGMVLQALYRHGLVPQPHYLAVFALGGDLQTIGQRFALHREGVVAHRVQPLVESLEKPLAVMPYAARLAVHETLCAHDLRAESLRYRLVAEADAENRNLSRERLYRLKRDPRAVGVTRARRDDQRFRGFRRYSGDVDLVVSHHLYLGVERSHHLHEVVGERIVIVDHDHHESSSANFTASKTALALFSVSSYSLSASESATMPAPARIVSREPSLTSVRMTIAKSMSPVSEK